MLVALLNVEELDVARFVRIPLAASSTGLRGAYAYPAKNAWCSDQVLVVKIENSYRSTAREG